MKCFKGSLLIVFATFLGSFSIRAHAACAKAQVVAGTTCKTLFVKFDLEACPEKSSEAQPVIKCNGDQGQVTLKSSRTSYSVGVKKGADGTWATTGETNEVSLVKPKPVVVKPRKPARPAKIANVKPVPNAAPVPVPAAAIPAPVAAAPPPAPAPPSNVSAPEPQVAAPVAPVAPPAVAAPTVPASTVQIQIPRNLKVAGSFRTRYESDYLTDLATKREYIQIRGRLDVTYSVNPKWTFFAQPQYAKTFGEPTLQPSSTTANSYQESSGTVSDSALALHQIYGTYKPREFLDLTIGRQTLSYGDELVLGALEWHNVGRSFDAIKARARYGKGWSDVFLARLKDSGTPDRTATPNATAAGNKDMLGLYNSYRVADWMKELDTYWIYRHDSAAATETNLNAVGARVKSDVGMIDYRVEYTNESGSRRDAYQVDAELGATLASSSLKPRVSIEAFVASEEFDQLYPTAHKWLGYADVLGRRNIQGYAAHFSLKPSATLTTTVDYHWFDRKNLNVAAYKLDGNTALGTASDQRHIGEELNLQARWAIDSSTSLTGGYAQFFKGDYMKQFNVADPYSYYFILEVKF